MAVNSYLSDVLRVVQRRSLLALLATSITVAVLEAASVSAIIPAIGLIVGADMPPLAARGLSALGLDSPIAQKVALLAAIAAVFVGRGVLLGGIIFLQARIAFNTQKQLSSLLYDRYLRAPFEKVTDIPSTLLVRTSTTELANVTHGILLPICILASEFALVFGSLIVLVILQPWTSFGLLLSMTLLTIPLVRINRRRLGRLGQTRHDMEENRVRLAQELSTGLREIKVYTLEQQLRLGIERTNDTYAGVMTRLTFLQNLPRIYFETTGLALLLLMCALQLVQGRSSSEIMLFLTVSGIAAFRSLPSVAKVLAQLQALRFYRPSLTTFLELVERLDHVSTPVSPPTGPAEAVAERRVSIEMRGASYAHAGEAAPVFTGVDLTVGSGQVVGLVGPSGVGKSTLLDCLIGLRRLSAGQVTVRDAATGEPVVPRVAYVPQSPVMMDATVWRNLTLAQHDPDGEPTVTPRLAQALAISGFDALMQSRRLSFASRIVEGGRNLSGGQRQRLALARAIHRDADVLVLDESTSALDKDSEQRVIEALRARGGHQLIVLVTHREELLSHCDQIVQMQAGQVHVRRMAEAGGAAA